MFEIVKAIHEALHTQSTWAFVLIVALIFGSTSGGLAWVVDQGYKNTLREIDTVRITGLDLEPIVTGEPIKLRVSLMNEGPETKKVISKFTAVWVDKLPKDTEPVKIGEIEGLVWNQLQHGKPLTLNNDNQTGPEPVFLSLPSKISVDVIPTSIIEGSEESVKQLNGDAGLYFCGEFTDESGKRVARYCVRIDKHRNQFLSLCRDYN
jgi:hypothetical protein